MQQVSHRVLRSDIDKSATDAKKVGRPKGMPRKVKHTPSKRKDHENEETLPEKEEKQETKPVQCTMCDLSFTTNAALLRHMRAHKRSNTDTDSDDSLEGAPSPVGPPRSRKRRLEFNNNNRDINGTAEDDTFLKRKPKTINNNTIDETEIRNLTCPVCDIKDFVSVSVLENHMDTEHPDYQVKCVICNLGFKNHRALNLHRFMVHNADREKIDSVSGFNDCTFIDFSSQKFPQIAKEVCEKSLHKSITDQRFMCAFCMREFPCGSALEIHRMSCNGQGSVSDGEERSIKRRRQSSCTDEDIKREDFFANLDLQNKSPTTSSPQVRPPQEEKKPRMYHDFYPKDIIRPIIDTSKDLADIQSILSVTSTGGLLEQLTKKSHEALNTPNSSDHGSGKGSEDHEEGQDLFAAEFRKMKLRGEFPCRLCTAIFPNLRALKGHNRVHLSGNGPGPYRCNMCPHSSMDKAALVRHMRTHNGDRPYECAVCNYAFTTKANCERHLRNRHSKVTREEVKRSIIYHPSEDPNNDEVNSKLMSREEVKRSLMFNSSNESDHHEDVDRHHMDKGPQIPHFRDQVQHPIPIPIPRDLSIVIPQPRDIMRAHCSVDPIMNTPPLSDESHPRLKVKGFGQLTQIPEFKQVPEYPPSEPDKQEIDDDDEEDIPDDAYIGKPLNYSSEMPIDLSTTECQDDALDLSKKSTDKSNENSEAEREDTAIPKTIEFNNNYPSASVLEKTQQFLLAQQQLLKGIQMPKLDPAAGFYANQLSHLYRSGAAFPLGLPPPFPINPYFLHNHPFLAQSNNPNITEMKERLQKEIIRGLQMSGGGLVGIDPNHLMNNMTLASERLQAFHQQVMNNIPNQEQKPLISPHPQIKSEDERKTPLHVVVDQPATISYANPVLSSPKAQKKDVVSSNSPNSVKMVIKNGVLMPKQKQRRYRTERPFTCEHCSARFTLRSNMERHIKQQHPQYWSQRQRSNIGTMPRKAPISMVPQNITVPTLNFENRLNFIKNINESTSPTNEDKDQMSPLSKTYSMISDQVKYAILAQQLKAQNNNTNKHQQLNGENEEEDEDDALVIDEESEDDKEHVVKESKSSPEPEHPMAKKVAQEILKSQDDLAKDYERKITGSLISKNPQQPIIPTVVSQIGQAENNSEASKHEGKSEEGDLVSVSRLLDNAASHMPFGKYFKNDMNPNMECHKDDISMCHGEGSEEDEEGLVASGSTSEGNNSGSDENRSESETNQQPQKKKSAYSLAPNRVSCPYCHRKFPWSSSLRRHVLTHTGQKPYKCAHCPLLFTTKSNCDRHLLRKHGNQINQSQNGSGASTLELPPNSIPIPGLGNQGFMMRNVPERPYKCASCPSSTFSTLCNLKKHMSSKHGIAIGESSPGSPKNDDGAFSAPENRDHDQHSASEDEKSYKTIDNSEHESSVSKSETKSSSELSGNKSDWENQIHYSKCSPYHGGDSLTTSQSSDLPFKCHLCEGSYAERQEALDHIKYCHATEFELLMSKGALETNSSVEEQGSSGHKSETGEEQQGDENIEHLRGKFPDYANRKVVCAFCVRRFWSAEDLRRHMRTHTGERPYSCDICKRRFTLKHSMLRHRKKHNPDRVVTSNEDLSMISGDEDTPVRNISPVPTFTGTSTPVAAKMTLNGYQMAIKNKQLSVSPEIPSNVNNNNSPPVHGAKAARSYSSDENECQENEIESGTDLIGNLLGISDRGMINKLLSSADEAAKLLGVNK